MDKRSVYADNAATTPVSDEVLASMLKVLRGYPGNPSGIYRYGREASLLLEEARATVAAALGADSDEIIFTASGSEADNLAIKGAAKAASRRGKHIVSCAVEHHAVLRSLEALGREGFEVTLVAPDHDGIIHPDRVANAIRPDTSLVAVMLANNETGSIQPAEEIARAAKARGALFFTDAVQAVGNIPVNVKTLGADMLSLSGHKIGAPKGIGALYVRRGTPLIPLIDGGGQERGLRGGTENVAFAVGLAEAMRSAINRLDDSDRIASMRDRLARGILASVPDSEITGGMKRRLPGNLSLVFGGVDGESLVLLLDAAGISVSSASACSASSHGPSHVLLALGVDPGRALGSLRLTLSHANTDEDVDYILEKLPAAVRTLRGI